MSWTREEWEGHGAKAILDLVHERGVVTWGEVEARISLVGWNNYRKVQPIQLSGALRRLLEEDSPPLVVETTGHPEEQAVRTLRIPFPKGKKREIERLRGRKRKVYLRYISWAQDEDLCGSYGEQVVYETLLHASPSAGLVVPQQVIGDITEVAGVSLPGEQTVDLWAWILKSPDSAIPEVDLPMVIEVKNKRHWLYADAPELWQVLIRAAHLAQTRPVLPVLACCWSGPTAWFMAYDVGFFTGQLREQVFSPKIDAEKFEHVQEDTGLLISQHSGPLPSLKKWLDSDLRKRPPSPPDEDVQWYRRQAERFAILAPHVLEFQALAGNLDTAARRETFRAWRQRVRAEAQWPLFGKW